MAQRLGIIYIFVVRQNSFCDVEPFERKFVVSNKFINAAKVENGRKVKPVYDNRLLEAICTYKIVIFVVGLDCFHEPHGRLGVAAAAFFVQGFDQFLVVLERMGHLASDALVFVD